MARLIKSSRSQVQCRVRSTCLRTGRWRLIPAIPMACSPRMRMSSTPTCSRSSGL